MTFDELKDLDGMGSDDITKPDRPIRFCKWCRVPWSEFLDAYHGREVRYQGACKSCQKLSDPSSAVPWYVGT